MRYEWILIVGGGNGDVRHWRFKFIKWSGWFRLLWPGREFHRRMVIGKNELRWAFTVDRGMEKLLGYWRRRRRRRRRRRSSSRRRRRRRGIVLFDPFYMIIFPTHVLVFDHRRLSIFYCTKPPTGAGRPSKVVAAWIVEWWLSWIVKWWLSWFVDWWLSWFVVWWLSWIIKRWLSWIVEFKIGPAVREI